MSKGLLSAVALPALAAALAAFIAPPPVHAAQIVNGLSENGIEGQGAQLQGQNLNGIWENGAEGQGNEEQGGTLNGREATDLSALALEAVRLPDGRVLRRAAE